MLWWTGGDNAALAAVNTNDAVASSTALPSVPTPPEGSLIKLVSSGVQFGDVRLGKGPLITESSSSGTSDAEGDKTTIVLHIRAILYDESVLFDTTLDGDKKPVLHEIGSINYANFFGGPGGGDSNNVKRSKVTVGIEDAILARGKASWEAGTISGKAEPMREGGIRRIVVPGPLAYGTAGVSRYAAMKLELRKPVPRDEIVRYEVEILRCLDVQLPTLQPEGAKSKKISSSSPSNELDDARTASTGTVCCPEELFPCYD